jgi:nucleoside-triphosphatase THEP1
MYGHHPFVERIKKREDVKIFEVTRKNRNQMVNILVNELAGGSKAKVSSGEKGA